MGNNTRRTNMFEVQTSKTACNKKKTSMHFSIAENCKMWDVGSETGKFSSISLSVFVFKINGITFLFIDMECMLLPSSIRIV